MPKSDNLNKNDNRFATQMQTFKAAIDKYSDTLGVSADQVASQRTDANYFSYVLDSQGSDAERRAAQWTAWKDIMRGDGSPPTAGAPAPPALPGAVPPVAPGIEARFRALVKQVKAHANYNSAIGQALGIEGAAQTGPDLATVQPEITVEASGNTVVVGWGWGGNSAYLDLCEIQVDRADGKGFILLTYDSTPNYTDTQPFPATPAKWTYKAIYRVGDHQVGQWSKPVSLTISC
jgi:hypothetical protein